MVRNPFNGMKCMTLEEKRKHVLDISLNFPVINEDVLPDYLVEIYNECKRAFQGYYSELSKELESKEK